MTKKKLKFNYVILGKNMELFRGVSKNNSLCDRCIQDLLNRFHATDRF